MIGRFGIEVAKLTLLSLSSPKREHYVNGMLIIACTNGNLAFVQWIYYEHHHLVNQCEMAFYVACENGYIEVAQWLYSVCPNIKMMDVLSFSYTVANGHLKVAEWIYSICPNLITEPTYRAMFSLACHRGNLQIAQWVRSISPPFNKKLYTDTALFISKHCVHSHVLTWLLEVSEQCTE